MKPASGRQQQSSNGISPIDLDEVICSGSDDDYYDSPYDRQRKYEVQKQRFLQGRPVTILSAHLRGPFTKESGWQNPWLGKSSGNSGPTQPVVQNSNVTKSKIPARDVPDSAAKVAHSDFGRAHVSVAPLRIDRLTQSSSCHLPSPLSSRSHAITVNPYMDGSAWTRVQAWRMDVAAKAKPVEEATATVTPNARGVKPIRSQSKRPASSELLRDALFKRRRSSINGLGQSSPGESSNATGQNHTPTWRKHVSNIQLSTPNNQLLRSSFVATTDFAIANDGSIAEQTDIPRAAQRNASPAGDAMIENGFSIPPHVVAGDRVNDVPVTPHRRSQAMAAGQRSGSVSKASRPERSPLRPNVTKINTMINAESLSHDSKRIPATRATVGFGRTTDVPTEVEPVQDFCSQADRSFQYRSKAPKPSKKVAMIEPPREVLLSGSLSGTGSTETGPPTEEIIQKESLDVSFPIAAVEQRRVSSGEDTSMPSSATNDTSVIKEDAADTAIPGIDGPTLIPTSSAPSRQPQEGPSSSSGLGKGVLVARDVRRKAGDRGDYALPKSNSASKHKTPPNKLGKVIYQPHSVLIESAKPIVHQKTAELQQIGQQAPQTSKSEPAEGLREPLSVSESNEGSDVDRHANPDRLSSLKPSTAPGSCPVLPSPQEQSPWARDIIHIIQTTTDHQPQSNSPQQASDPESKHSEPTEDPEPNHHLPVTPVNQSPWTKEISLPTAGIPAKMNSLPLGDSVKKVLLDTDVVEATALQNPWVSDKRPGDALDLVSGTRSPQVTPSQRLRLTGGAISPDVPPTCHSPIQQEDVIMNVLNTTQSVQVPPSTPATKQSSLPTPDLTSSIKSFRDFMSPSPQPRRRSKRMSSPTFRIEKIQRCRSILSKSHKQRANRGHLRVSFALPAQNTSSSPMMDTDPDETMDGAELPTREAESPSLVRRASIQAPSRRAASPPLELSQSELPAEGTRFSKFFQAQARKGPQVRRAASYKPLLPSASQQMCGSPGFDAMAEAFIEADMARGEPDVDMDSADSPEVEKGEEEQAVDDEAMSTQENETDDVTAVLDNLGDFLNSFDVDAELVKARRQEQQRETPQELGMGFPSTQDQMEIMGAGVWD